MTLVSFLIYCITQALGNIYIRLNPPTDLGIIESRLEIVHSDITIIVISTISERINIGNVSILGRVTIQELSCYVTPSIVSVGCKLDSICVIDRNDIALQVLFKEVAVVNIFSIGRSSILESYG